MHQHCAYEPALNASSALQMRQESCLISTEDCRHVETFWQNILGEKGTRFQLKNLEVRWLTACQYCSSQRCFRFIIWYSETSDEEKEEGREVRLQLLVATRCHREYRDHSAIQFCMTLTESRRLLIEYEYKLLRIRQLAHFIAHRIHISFCVTKLQGFSENVSSLLQSVCKGNYQVLIFKYPAAFHQQLLCFVRNALCGPAVSPI